MFLFLGRRWLGIFSLWKKMNACCDCQRHFITELTASFRHFLSPWSFQKQMAALFVSDQMIISSNSMMDKSNLTCGQWADFSVPCLQCAEGHKLTEDIPGCCLLFVNWSVAHCLTILSHPNKVLHAEQIRAWCANLDSKQITKRDYRTCRLQILTV